MAHVAGEAAQHHDQHPQSTATVIEQEADVFEDIGCDIAGADHLARQYRLAHHGGDDQQQQAAAQQHPGRGVSFENGTAHHQGDQGANDEFQHMLPSDWMRVEGVYSDRGRVATGNRMLCELNQRLTP